MLRRPAGVWPLLPRPFSICRVNGSKISFLIKVIGPGTRSLGQAKNGELVYCTGPLGHPFPQVNADEGVTVLAGGIGIAPFPLVLDRAIAGGVSKEKLTLLFGSRDRSMLYDKESFQKLGIQVLTATDDGSDGFKGNAVALLRQEIQAKRIPKNRPIFVCGPERMLEAAAHYAQAESLKMLLSLENFMACGVGVCNGCSVTVEPSKFDGWPYAKACREGPTFEASCLKI